jgi:hypothetical protein
MHRISNYLERVLHKIPKLTHKYNGRLPCHGGGRDFQMKFFYLHVENIITVILSLFPMDTSQK